MIGSVSRLPPLLLRRNFVVFSLQIRLGFFGFGEGGLQPCHLPQQCIFQFRQHRHCILFTISKTRMVVMMMDGSLLLGFGPCFVADRSRSLVRRSL